MARPTHPTATASSTSAGWVRSRRRRISLGDEVAGEVDDGEREHARRAEAVPVDGEERDRRGHDEQEPEVDGDHGPEAEQALRRPRLRRFCRRSLRLHGRELVPEVVDLIRVVPVCGEPPLELLRRDVDVGAVARVGGGSVVVIAHLLCSEQAVPSWRPRREPSAHRGFVHVCSGFPAPRRGGGGSPRADGAILRPRADVAQLVERLLAMQKVVSSSPIIRFQNPR